MAEQSSVYDLKGLEQQFHSLFCRYTCNDLQADSKPFCSSFCKLVEHYTSCWKVPLPQLRILERALCCFTQASAFLTVGCDHVLRTLSSLALSIFELLLFFDQKDFTQDPLRKITVTFQECFSSLARFQNVHLLQVERLLQAGGLWVSQTLHAILSESTLPQTEVKGCISSEPPVFFELRVRYLLSCQRLPEAQALAKCCAQHPTVGQHLFFFQVYLTGLYKTAQHERLLEEVADFSGKDAVNFICSLETEEKDDLLLGFSRVFLSQQLRRGDMHFLCDLVCLWSRLHSRLKTSKDALLKECEQLILSATNVNAIFPFIRAIIQELSEEGVQFCMELCANSLRSCPTCDVITKSLIYKTMASLVPNDLEICRACALLVFFLERSVEAYKMVYILYMHPDQEYHVDCCPIGNRVRFETLQTLKKDLYFDPEFWNLIALRTNCLKLINEKVLSAALEEIMEEKWVPSYCLKEIKSSSSRSKFTKKNGLNKEKTHKGDRQNHKYTADKAPAKKVGRPRLNKHLPLKKGNQGSRQWKDVSSEPTRRSAFWQLDRKHCNSALDSRENRRTTRLSEKIPAKRMIRTPKWLLEDSGTLEKNAPSVVKRQYPSFPYLPLRRRRVVVRNNSKDNTKSEEKLIENQLNDIKHEKSEVQLDSQTASTAPQVVLELSLPDNELLGTFTDEPCNRYRGLPQRLYYKPTVKVPSETKPEQASLQNEAILKAHNMSSFIMMLHCYSKRPKGKNIGTNSQGSSSSVTRSSDQVGASNKEQLNDKPAVEMKVTISSQTPQRTDKILQNSSETLHEKGAVTRDTDTIIEPKVTRAVSLATAIAESAVEMEVKVATQENRHSPRLEKTQNIEHISCTVFKKATSEKPEDEVDGKPPVVSAREESKPQEALVAHGEVLVNGTRSQEDDLTSTENSQVPFDKPMAEEPVAEAETIDVQTPMDNVTNLPCVTVKTESKIETPQSPDKRKDDAASNSNPIVSKIEKEHSKSLLVSSPPSNAAWEDDGFDPMEPQPECEESKLEFCCFFCHKDVKGRHLVAHAMFHYRRDECMFCGVAFKNNLKAMMHLSNHLEKLKKLQNPTTNKSPTQSKAKQKTADKAQIVPNEKKKRGRPKKPLPTVRKLRSGYKFRDRTIQEEGGSKDLRTKDHVHKVNGHVGNRIKKKETNENNLITKTRLRHRSIDIHRNNEIKPVKIEKEKPLFISSEQKHEQIVTSKTHKQMDIKNIGHQEKLCCPADGCTWYTVKKHAAFLYHVLENHYPNAKPLELAFRMASNSCSICKRVLYSFEHFQHHVGRHISVPRHPCPHKGCTARFKTTIEMRRHARKHSPLQAVCCLPGCPKLFICQWALILHEKDHFSKRSKATQYNDKPKTQAVVKQEKEKDITKSVKSKEKVAPTSTDKSPKDTHKAHDSLFSKKDRSAQSAATRLLLRMRKRQIAKNNLPQHISHKTVSSVGKTNYKGGKTKHSLQRRESKAKRSISCKVLPPRQAKSSQNSSCVKNLKKSNQLKTLEVHKKITEGYKNPNDCSTISTRKISNKLQRFTNAAANRKAQRIVSSCSKDNSKISNKRPNKYVKRKFKRPAPVHNSLVLEENANMETTDTNDGMAVVRIRKRSKKHAMEEMEQAQTPINAEDVSCQDGKYISTPTSVDSKFVVENVLEATVQHAHDAEGGAMVATATSSNVNSISEATMNAAVTEGDLAPVPGNLTVESLDTGKDQMVSKAEKCEQRPADYLEHSEQETSKMETTDSSENAPVNLPIVANTDGVHQVTFEKGAEKDSNMVPSPHTPCNTCSITDTEQNMASSQNAEREIVTIGHVFEPTVVTVVQSPLHKADDVEYSVEMANRPTLADHANAYPFENTLQVENKVLSVAAEDISILEKWESKDFTANANTSLLDEVKTEEPEHITVDKPICLDIPAKNKSGHNVNISNLNEASEPAMAEKRLRPKFCNKGDILSALKTLVKSKNDKVQTKNEVKNSTTKRKNEQIKASSSKKLKSEMHAKEDVAATVNTYSSSEEKKATETTDSSSTNSCAPVSTLSNENMASKEKDGKVGKFRSKCQSTSKNNLKKPTTIQSKTKKKQKISNKNALDKSNKKTKRQKLEAESVKKKSKDGKIEANASTKLDTSPPEDSLVGSNEVSSQPMPTEDSSPASNEQYLNRQNDSINKEIQVEKVEANLEMPRAGAVQNVKEPQDEACLNQRNVYDLVPEEEESPLATFEKALNEYKKRPYMRLPATAYLEEKFTVMPKRRKDMSMFFGSSKKIQATPQQRQRCANCFNTFSSEEELQWHLQQKCSNLFGFDSDEEGTT